MQIIDLKKFRFEKRDFARFAWEAALDLTQCGLDAPPCSPSAFEDYVRSRLQAEAKPNLWLDHMPLSEAIKLCEIFGTLLTQGHFARVADVANEKWGPIRQAGFSLLQEGPEHLHQLLFERLQAMDRTKWIGLKSLIGPAAELLKRHRDQPSRFDLFRMEMAKFAEAHLHDRIYGNKLQPNPGQVSLAEASTRFKLPQERLTRAASRLKLADVPEKMDTRTVLRIVREAKRRWSNNEARQALNVSNEVLWVLADGGSLGPVDRKSIEKAHRRFDGDAIERLLASIDEVATAGPADSKDWVSISEAAVRYKRSCHEILSLVINGDLSRVHRAHPAQAIGGLSLCGAEIFKKLYGVDWNGVSVRRGSKYLGTTFEVVAKLLSHQHLIHIRDETPTRAIIYISEPSLIEFKERYVSLSELSRLLAMSMSRLSRRFMDRGIWPAIEREEVGATFFLRGEVL